MVSHFGSSIHWRVKVSVLESVGGAGSHLGTSQVPRLLLSRGDKPLLPPALRIPQWWVAGVVVAAAAAACAQA